MNSKIGEITVDLLKKGTSLKQYPYEKTETFLERLTNLSLQGRQIEVITNLQLCPMLRVLFLYNNRLTSLENINVARQLTHVYLENNQISEMNGLRGLFNLVKLCLDGNKISKVEGIEGCPNLQELHINNQRLDPGVMLTFDMNAMESVSESLCVLTVNNSNLLDLSPLCCLLNLQTLKAGMNQIYDMKHVEELLKHCTLLQEIELEDNPVAKTRNYRDILITNSELLQVIDDKPVKPNQRSFLQARDKRRKRKQIANERVHAIREVHMAALSDNPERLLPNVAFRESSSTNNNNVTDTNKSAPPPVHKAIPQYKRSVSNPLLRRQPKILKNRSPSPSRPPPSPGTLEFRPTLNVGKATLGPTIPRKPPATLDYLYMRSKTSHR